MQRNLLIRGVGFLFFILLLGCEKDEGTQDPLEEPYRYIQGVTINSIPEFDWDLLSKPDLQVFMKRASVSDWEFRTQLINNNDSYPVYLTFNNEVLATNETYELTVFAFDDLNANDPICEIQFNPKENGSEGKIKFDKNGVNTLEIHYIVR